MKNIASVTLSLLFLVATTGVTFNHHYCGGHLSYSKIVVADNSHDCCGGMPMDAGCCEDEFKNLQVKDNFYSSFVQADVLPDLQITGWITTFNFQSETYPSVLITADNTGSPPGFDIPLFLLNSSFLC